MPSTPKTQMYNLEYHAGGKFIQTLVFNMTKGFCKMKKKESIESGRFNSKKFKMKKVKKS
jgi:hypothetical protein